MIIVVWIARFCCITIITIKTEKNEGWSYKLFVILESLECLRAYRQCQEVQQDEI